MMSPKAVCLLLLAASTAGRASAFTAALPRAAAASSRTALSGYLDDLSSDLNAADPNPDVYADSKEATDMKKEELDRYGPGDFSQFVDFHEFDGGDGRE